jgi:hypothetical protein
MIVILDRAKRDPPSDAERFSFPSRDHPALRIRLFAQYLDLLEHDAVGSTAAGASWAN